MLLQPFSGSRKTGRHWSDAKRITSKRKPPAGVRDTLSRGHDPESKGLVENLVGYAKSDLMVAQELSVADLAAANAQRRQWCAEVNAAVNSEIAAVPDQRLAREVELLRPLPSLRAQIGNR